MNCIKKFIDENKLIILLLTVYVSITFGVFINKPFYINADQVNEYHIFYQEWMDLLKNFVRGEGFPLYSWTSFLGGDFYASKLLYVTGDPFIPLFFLIDNIPLTLLIETILLVYISGFSFNLFLKEFGINKRNVRNLCSVVYAICGWATILYSQYMFHRFFAFLPILFFSIEYYINKKKVMPLILITAFLFIQSYYYMFPISVILFIYALFTLYQKNETDKILKYAKVLIPSYLLGFLLSAFAVFPAIYVVLQNSRVGDSSGFSFFWDSNVNLGLTSSFIVNPFPIHLNIPNIFKYGNNGHGFGYSLYISILATSGALALIFNKNRFKKYFPIMFVLALFTFIKPLSSILHGFSEPSLRWTFCINIIMLLFAAIYFDKYFDKKEYLKIGLSYILILVILYFIYFLVNYDYINIYRTHIMSVVFSLALSLLILCIFNKSKIIGIIVSFFELSILSSFLIFSFSNQYYEYNPTIEKEYIQYYADKDEDIMYRMYIDNKHLLPSSVMNLNQPMNYGFMSTTTYDSLYEASLNPFLESIGIGGHIININDYIVNNMLGVKYYIVYNEDELPSLGEFEFVYNLNHLKVYKDINYKSIGHTYTKFSNELSDDCTYGSCLIIDDQDIINKSTEVNDSTNFKFISKNQNRFSGNITTKDFSILYFALPYSEGWEATVNGKDVDLLSVNNGFLGLSLEPGEYKIEFKYKTPLFMEGVLTTISSVILSSFLCMFKLFKRRKWL